LRELVALPSVNPAFLPAQDPRGGEQRVAEFLASVAARAGLDVEFRPVLPGRANFFARLAPRGKSRRRILLAPHLDTVNGTPEQFRPRVKQGRLFGRGACDTKGSVAAMLMALCQLAGEGPRPAETEIMFVGLVDEEHGQAGSRALAASGFKADLAIIGEATRLQVVTAHKGSLWLRLQTRGRAAHGSKPELGRNAIYAMARVIGLLENEYADRLRRRRHPLLGCATVSVGVVSGGTQPNIVPDQCTIVVDRRTLPRETEASVCREICELMHKKRLGISIAGGKLEPCRPLETDPKLPLVSQFLRCVGQPKPGAVHYFCDAAVLAGGGIPSVVFGPGDIAQAHTSDEWISLAEMERAKDLLVRYLRACGA
jgi:acetylornithine deacetylase/succinyl-diaminopimelate desuccinylase-like protein